MYENLAIYLSQNTSEYWISLDHWLLEGL